MPWFSKKSKQIEAVPPEERVVKTENVFVKCDGCEAHLYKRELEEGLQVCSHCGYHFRIGARERLAMLFDDGKFEELDAEVISIDPLEFVDTKPYPARLKQAKKNSGLPEAIINARGKVGDHLVLAGRDGHVVHRRLDGIGGRRESYPTDRASLERARRGGHLCYFRRRAHAGGRTLANADG